MAKSKNTRKSKISKKAKLRILLFFIIFGGIIGSLSYSFFSNVNKIVSIKKEKQVLNDRIEELTDEEKEFLEETAQLMLKYPTIPCNDCKYCMPCPYGLDIPAILLHYNRCVNEGNVPENGQDENYAKARRAFLIGYDRSVPKLRQASHCIGCNQCVSHCPQNIDIPKELHRIDQFVEQLKQGTL